MLGATACLSESIAHDLGLALSLVAFRDETNRAPLTQNGVALEGGIVVWGSVGAISRSTYSVLDYMRAA